MPGSSPGDSVGTGPSPAGGAALKEAIRAAGVELGFDLVGFARAEEPFGSRRLQDWLARGFHGSMSWMARDPEGRVEPDRILQGMRAAVVVGLCYYHPDPAPARPGAPRISRYAWGDDYHAVMNAKLRALEARLREILGEPMRTRISCDTSPVMDKAWAVAGGIGWLGKNACLIHPESGSWLFLGEIFLDRELPPDPMILDHCGTCRRCLEACPTGALVEPYVLDARRCISYLTIEHRSEFDPWQKEAVGGWLAGCDICQDVCPWNRKVESTDRVEFAPRPDLVNRGTEEWRDQTDAEYRAAVRGTALTRIKPEMMRRNARAVQENLDAPPSSRTGST